VNDGARLEPGGRTCQWPVVAVRPRRVGGGQRSCRAFFNALLGSGGASQPGTGGTLCADARRARCRLFAFSISISHNGFLAESAIPRMSPAGFSVVWSERARVRGPGTCDPAPCAYTLPIYIRCVRYHAPIDIHSHARTRSHRVKHGRGRAHWAAWSSVAVAITRQPPLPGRRAVCRALEAGRGSPSLRLSGPPQRSW
jgi:hypothetical protein